MHKAMKRREVGKKITAQRKTMLASSIEKQKISIDIARNMCYNINGEHR